MSSRKSRLASSKHHLQVSNDPPSQLLNSQYVARIAKPHGNSLYTVEVPSKDEFLVELPVRFRNAIWVKRGGFVLVETEGFKEGKVNGEIVEVIRDEKAWTKMTYWWVFFFSRLIFRPDEFKRKDESDEEELAPESPDTDENGVAEVETENT